MASDGCAQVRLLVPRRGCIELTTLDLVGSHAPVPMHCAGAAAHAEASEASKRMPNGEHNRGPRRLCLVTLAGPTQRLRRAQGAQFQEKITHVAKSIEFAKSNF